MAAHQLRRELRVLRAGNEAEIDAAVANIAQRPGSAVLIATDPYFFARRNQIAAQLQREALSSEADAQARWNAAKDRGKLPGNNTEAGFTPATGNAFHQTGTRY